MTIYPPPPPPHDDCYDVTLTTLSEESAFDNVLNIPGRGDLSETIGDTLSFRFNAGEVVRPDLTSDGAPNVFDLFRLAVDYDGDGVIDAGETVDQDRVDNLTVQDILAATQDGRYDAFLSFEDWTDCDFNDLVVKVQLDACPPDDCDPCYPPPPPPPPPVVVGEVILGTAGADVLAGTAGNDRIFAGNGNDAIVGRQGNDFIVGGKGNDRMVGGLGDDVFFLRPNDGNDRIIDFDRLGDDVIDVRRLNIGLADVNQDVLANGNLVVTFDGFSNILRLDNTGPLGASDFIF